MKMKYIK